MDADDISLPSRLKNQFDYMEKHRNINILGTYAISFGDINEYLIDYNNYTKRYRQVLLLFQNSGLIHPTSMIRKSFLNKYDIQYDEYFRNAQDYRLWVECIKYTAIKVLPKIELLYRRHYNQSSASGKKIQNQYRDEIRLLQLKKLGIKLSEENKNIFLSFCNNNINIKELPKLNELCKLIISNNIKHKYYNAHILKGMLYSKCLLIVFKQRKTLSKLELVNYIYYYMCWNSISIYLYNKSIFFYNKIRKKKIKRNYDKYE